MTTTGGRIGGRQPPPARHRADAASDTATGSRLPASAVAVIAAAGVLVAAAADAAGRLGHASSPWADRLYWLGQALILAPAWVRIVSRRLLSAAGTVTIVVVLTVAEYLVKVCYGPAAFLHPDELTHWRSTVDVLQTGKLFTVNYLLPVSPRYPGLEEVAAALTAVTGLSVFAAGLIVAGVAHLLFVSVLYILFRNVSGSHRIAGVAVLLYASNPLFQSFDSMFIYQTVALPFLGLAVLAAWRLAKPDTSSNRLGWLMVAVLSVMATVVTHHVTSYVLGGTLVVIALAGLITGNRRTMGWAAMLAALSAVTIAGWLVFEAPQTLGYLQPAVEGTLQSFRILLAGGHSSAPPASAGPLGNQALGAAGVVTLSVLLPFGWWQVWRRLRHQSWVVAMAIGSASWYAIVAVRLAVADGSELAGRAATFVYVPAGFVAALALAQFIATAYRGRTIGGPKRWHAPFAVAAVLAGGLLLMFDGLANGWPPYWERLPGPHQVAGTERSVGPEEIAAARWALAALGPGNRFAVDSGSYPVLGSYGDQEPVRDIAYLYTSAAFTRSDVRRAQEQALRYLLVDRRLAAALPVSGQYFPVDPDAGRYSGPLRAADLAKFDSAPGVARLYDSGDIVIYDLRRAGYAR
ncbi:MAG TPA: hypothetical protein VIV12_22225 [Streptosporangiaceae bacterium]